MSLDLACMSSLKKVRLIKKIETNKEKGFANLEFCRPQSMPRLLIA
jgi:RNA recognition motif-containing protein